MGSNKRKVSRVMGLITIICAMGMAILNLSQGKPFDEYIMPVIFLAAGISFLMLKQTERIFLGGIVTLIITLV